MKPRTKALIDNKIWEYLEIATTNNLEVIRNIVNAILAERGEEE